MILFLVICLLPMRAVAINGGFSANHGSSFGLIEKRYRQFSGDGERGWQQYCTPKLKNMHDFSLTVYIKHIGITANVFKQMYNTVQHKIDPAGEYSESWQDNFVYYGFRLECRFFADNQRRFNSHVGVGLLFLFYLAPFDSGAPEYPATSDLKFSGGLRYKVLPSNSIINLTAGLSIIL